MLAILPTAFGKSMAFTLFALAKQVMQRLQNVCVVVISALSSITCCSSRRDVLTWPRCCSIENGFSPLNALNGIISNCIKRVIHWLSDAGFVAILPTGYGKVLYFLYMCWQSKN